MRVGVGSVRRVSVGGEVGVVLARWRARIVDILRMWLSWWLGMRLDWIFDAEMSLVSMRLGYQSDVCGINVTFVSSQYCFVLVCENEVVSIGCGVGSC